MQNPQYIGDQVWTAKAFNPVAQAAGTITGDSFDRMTQGAEQGFQSCVLHLVTGTHTGTPDAVSVATVLEDSADNSSWAAVSDVTVASITAINTNGRNEINLKPLRRYVRAVSTVSFTGGTTPTLVVSGVFVFGGAQKLPVASMTT